MLNYQRVICLDGFGFFLVELGCLFFFRFDFLGVEFGWFFFFFDWIFLWILDGFLRLAPFFEGNLDWEI